MLDLNLGFRLVLFTFICSISSAQSRCTRGCDLALGSYYVEQGNDLTSISLYFQTTIPDILKYNPSIPNQDSLQAFSRIRVPFSCDCINGEFLGHLFEYDIKSEDTYTKVAENWYANLTSEEWIQRFNSYGENRIPDTGTLNVTVNCSCGDGSISKDYGLFLTYPLRPGENLDAVSSEVNVTSELIRRYNSGADFTAGSGLLFIPERGQYLELIFLFFMDGSQSRCTSGCDLALGSYYVEQGNDLTSISRYFQTTIPDILKYNPSIPNQDSLQSFVRIRVPFSCDCINGEFLGRVFNYDVSTNDTYIKVADDKYANLTTADWIQRFNSYGANRIPDTGSLNVTVNCSCGDNSVSKDYGLFLTYPLRPGETLDSVSSEANLSSQLIRSYNPGANFTLGSGLVFIPGRGLSGGVIGGIVVGVVAVVLLLAGCYYFGYYKKKNAETSSALLKNAQVQLMRDQGTNGSLVRGSESSGLPAGATPGLTGITVDKSVEFSYEELSTATDDFSLANKIGQGGFGVVYYAELRGEKAAIKKMDMQASREFLAELKVLTHVHHLNLVRLIGYCVEGSLFLVYEYIENGNLSQHLHGSAREPLPWSTRVQIALDSARGLEYIHEHTVPVYIHRDIKSANILIDKNFHGKVADFGLTKLTEVGSTSLPTRLVGTFGYMPPEYAQYGDVSPKIDVYAFGVVLYELISAKEAIVKANGSVAESKGLVSLFEEVLSQPDPKDDLVKVIDPRLGDNYPLDSVRKMAQLAKACTHENPQLRPSMRSIVVALMTLSSSTEDWDVGSFYENQTLVSLMSGR
ncbi:hypothetical protein SSX86_005693 [Deinandra increscens subsp. villosa]|uniref:non-specific serine/threonine protein kinase n=1 Tax=Deinandra increscens subsp. villosa TaxID=3103831 RepID=A0AAP0HA36_9ASTR